jgi:hypothetical protein
MKILKEFTVVVEGYLTEKQSKEAKAALNLHYVGDEECNHVVGGRMVAKYPDKETESFKDSHYNVVRGYSGITVVQLLEDGTLKIKS